MNGKEQKERTAADAKKEFTPERWSDAEKKETNDAKWMIRDKT